MSREKLTVGLNLLGLPALGQGGAGLQAGIEAEGLAAAGIETRVLAGQQVVDELAGEDGLTTIAGNSPGGGVSGLLKEIPSPYGYGSGAAPGAAFDGCDVVHYPLGFVAAPRHRARSVVTAVDLQHLYFPEFFTRTDRVLRALRWHRSIKRADRVVTCSEVVKRSVTERLGVPASRIDVVPACCNPIFFSDPDVPVPSGEYFLYPASPLPNKNHGTLVRAFAELVAGRPGARLVLVGPLMHDWDPVRSAIAEAGLGDSVEIRGHVPLEELRGLYAGALGLVFPSLFEGFGIPALEAIAAGCPVVASDIPSLREICGDAAVYFEATDPEAIAHAMETVASMAESERGNLTERGRERAELFRPEVMIEGLVNSFTRSTGNIASS